MSCQFLLGCRGRQPNRYIVQRRARNAGSTVRISSRRGSVTCCAPISERSFSAHRGSGASAQMQKGIVSGGPHLRLCGGKESAGSPPGIGPSSPILRYRHCYSLSGHDTRRPVPLPFALSVMYDQSIQDHSFDLVYGHAIEDWQSGASDVGTDLSARQTARGQYGGSGGT